MDSINQVNPMNLTNSANVSHLDNFKDDHEPRENSPAFQDAWRARRRPSQTRIALHKGRAHFGTCFFVTQYLLLETEDSHTRSYRCRCRIAFRRRTYQSAKPPHPGGGKGRASPEKVGSTTIPPSCSAFKDCASTSVSSWSIAYPRSLNNFL